jgi:hypothetical protein
MYSFGKRSKKILHRPGNCLKVAYYSVKLTAKNLVLVISLTVLTVSRYLQKHSTGGSTIKDHFFSHEFFPSIIVHF